MKQNPTSLRVSEARLYMVEGKMRKVWRLYFLVPLPTQLRLQAAGFATQESGTQMCIPSPQNSTAASSPASLEFFPQLWFSSWPWSQEDWWDFPRETPLQCGWFCSAPASRAFWPWTVISDPTALSKTMGVLQGKHRCTRKQFHGSKLTLFPLRDRLKAGDFLPPWTSIEPEPEPLWCSVYTSGLKYDSTALLWALGALVKSSRHRIQIPIYLPSAFLRKNLL